MTTYRVKDLELWEDNPFQVDHKKVRDIAESMRLLKEQNLPPQLVPGKVWRDPKDKKLKVVFGRHRFLACQAAGIAVFEADELDARLKPHDVIELAGNEQSRRRDNTLESLKYFVKKNYPDLIDLDMRGKLGGGIEINGELVRNSAAWLHRKFKFSLKTAKLAMAELKREARGEPAQRETRYQVTDEQKEKIRRYQDRYWELEDRANEIRTQAADRVRELRERQKMCRDALRDYPGGPRQWLAKRPKS